MLQTQIAVSVADLVRDHSGYEQVAMFLDERQLLRLDFLDLFGIEVLCDRVASLGEVFAYILQKNVGTAELGNAFAAGHALVESSDRGGEPVDVREG